MEILKKTIKIAMSAILIFLLGITSLKNGILLSVVSFASIIFFVKKIKIKKFGVFLIVFCLITKILGALILHIPMSLDYQTMYDASQSAIKGNFSFLNSQYFTAYGYQLRSCFLSNINAFNL